VKYTTEEWVSGNGRNRCAAVCCGELTIATYHVRDSGKSYRAQAEAHTARLNAEHLAEMSKASRQADAQREVAL